MNRLATLRRLALVGLVAFALVGIGSTAAKAAHGGYGSISIGYGAGYGCVPHCHYKPVTVYITKRIRHVHYVTKFDHCGRPYRVPVVHYEYIRVPVTKYVKVCY